MQVLLAFGEAVMVEKELCRIPCRGEWKKSRQKGSKAKRTAEGNV
jgi:hypothetical protein